MTRTTRTTTSRPGIMSRLRGRTAPRSHTTRTTRNGLGGGTTTTTVTKTTKTTHHPGGVGGVGVAHHQKRRPSIGDKISGALLRIKGSLTRRPGRKAAGTRRMRGTDGRRSHRRRPCANSPSSSLSDISTVPSRKLSIATADAALNTAIDLVTQVKILQSRIVEIEDALDSKRAEIESLTQDRNEWQQRATAILGAKQDIVVPQSTTQEEEVPGQQREVNAELDKLVASDELLERKPQIQNVDASDPNEEAIPEPNKESTLPSYPTKEPQIVQLPASKPSSLASSTGKQLEEPDLGSINTNSATQDKIAEEIEKNAIQFETT